MKILNFLPSLPLLLLLGSPPTLAQRRPAARPRREPSGLSFLLAVRADGASVAASVEGVKAVVNKRCELLKVNCRIEPAPGGEPSRLALNVSGGLTSERARGVLLASGLEVLPVVSPPFPSPLQVYFSPSEAWRATGPGETVVAYAERAENLFGLLVVKRTPIITGADVRDPEAFVARGTRRSYDVSFGLSPEGSRRLAAWTGANINHYVAVVYNGQAVAARYVRAAVSENGEVNGRFTRAEVEDVLLVLTSGNLPAPVEILEEGARRP